MIRFAVYVHDTHNVLDRLPCSPSQLTLIVCSALCWLSQRRMLPMQQQQQRASSAVHNNSATPAAAAGDSNNKENQRVQPHSHLQTYRESSFRERGAAPAQPQEIRPSTTQAFRVRAPALYNWNY